MRSLPASLLLAAGIVLSPPLAGDARGDEAAPHRLAWTYPRFRTSEYLAASAFTAAGLYVENATRGLPDNGFHGGILLDVPIRDLLVAGTAEGRYAAASVSDVLWPVTQYFSIVDSLVTPLATDRANIDVAVQMTLINWQVQGVAFLLTRVAHRTVGRSRPLVAGCDENPDYDDACAENGHGLHASFVSGHASMSFASAAATCSHHMALPLYGGGPLDAGVCALTMASATTVGVLRIVADKHWWTDVMAGASIGVATGFGLPWLLHYSHALSVPGGPLGRSFVVLPMIGADVAGVSFVSVQ